MLNEKDTSMAARFVTLDWHLAVVQHAAETAYLRAVERERKTMRGRESGLSHDERLGLDALRGLCGLI